MMPEIPTSALAVLTVFSALVLTAPFSNQVTMVFSNVTLSLSVTGAPPLSYQWQQNGTLWVTVAESSAVRAGQTLSIGIRK